MLLSVDNGYKFYKIEDVNEFRKIRSLLVEPITEMQNQLPSIKTANQVLDETDSKLVSGGDYFGLWLITDHGKIIIAIISSVILNENYELCCYVNGRYFKKGMVYKFAGSAFHYIEDWAREKQCLKMIFLTGRNVKAYTRLLHRIGFKPTETLFTKELNYG